MMRMRVKRFYFVALTGLLVAAAQAADRGNSPSGGSHSDEDRITELELRQVATIADGVTDTFEGDIAKDEMDREVSLDRNANRTYISFVWTETPAPIHGFPGLPESGSYSLSGTSGWFREIRQSKRLRAGAGSHSRVETAGHFKLKRISGEPLNFLLLHTKHTLQPYDPNSYYTQMTQPVDPPVYHVDRYEWDGDQLKKNDSPVSLPLEDQTCYFEHGTVELLKVDVSSEKAANPNGTHTPKQTIEFAIPSPGNIATGEEQEALDNALVVYYKDVVGESTDVASFDIKFRTTGLHTTAWFETGNNNSGSTRGDLQNPVSEEATLTIAAQGGSISGPIDGGLYKYSASLSDSLSFPIQVWLPVAGPSIDSAFMAQIAGFSSWGSDYRDQLATVRVPAIKSGSPFTWGLLPNSEVARAVRLDDMRQLGNILDWYGSPSGQYPPSGGPKNNTPIGVQEHRTTIGGVVVDWPKRNNILYAVVGRNMGISTTLLEVGPNLVGGDNNTPDDQYAIASYNVGFRLFDEEGLSEVMADIGREMHVPGGWAEKEWPSFEVEPSASSIQLRQIAVLVMDLLLDEDGFHDSGN